MKRLPIFTDVQRIFILSRVNGAVYLERESPIKIAWPESTWFQRRLKELQNDSTVRPLQKTIQR